MGIKILRLSLNVKPIGPSSENDHNQLWINEFWLAHTQRFELGESSRGAARALV